jgi:hypothetical protein
MAKWTTNPTKAAEKVLLVSMVEYLREDPTVNDNLDIFRFICRDWYTLERTLHTKVTMDTVKRRLLALGVRYIQRTQDQNWTYWNDYSPFAIMEFYPASDDQPELSTEPQRPDDTETSTPVGFDNRQVLLEQSASMTPRSSQDPTAMTAPTGPERPSLETMHMVAPRHSTSQSGAASINIGGHTTDASESEPDTTDDEDEVIYLSTQKMYTPADDSNTSDGLPRLSSMDRKHATFPDIRVTEDEEGFTPVRTRQDRRQKR